MTRPLPSTMHWVTTAIASPWHPRPRQISCTTRAPMLTHMLYMLRWAMPIRPMRRIILPCILLQRLQELPATMTTPTISLLPWAVTATPKIRQFSAEPTMPTPCMPPKSMVRPPRFTPSSVMLTKRPNPPINMPVSWQHKANTCRLHSSMRRS